MDLSITNQRPTDFTPVYNLSIKGDYDPAAAIKATLVDPIFTPLVPGTSVQLVDKDNNNRAVTEAQLLETMIVAIGDTVNPVSNKAMKSLMRQTAITFEAASMLMFNETFAIQAGARLKLKPPSANVMYTEKMDVIPAAKRLLGGLAPDADELFTALAFIYHPETLGFYFNTAAEFEACKVWIAAQATLLSGVLPSDTVAMLTQFNALDLKGLTESILMRAHDGDQNHEYSFPRVITNLLMSYTQQATSAQFGIMPFVLSELYSPRSIVFINVEAHARARASKIQLEWKTIQASISSPVKIISNRALSKLTALARATVQAQQAATASTNKGSTTGRSAKIVFRKQKPSAASPLADILRVLKTMKQVNQSQNIFTQVKSTFNKANRRNPDDHNKPGTSVSVKYLPDLHIYIDTSGSISEKHYQATVIMLIQLARKMDVNLYFSSFSNMLSQETLLRTKGKSVKQIWEEFRRIPKVTGGTDYKQIWDYINASAKRKQRLSLVITDFQWQPGNRREDHPRNLYYAPMSAGNWDSLVYWAKNYVQCMHHIEPAIGQRIIGMVK